MENKKEKNYFQAAMLFLMLIILPGGSWIWLNKGYNRSKAALAEMQNYGHLPDFQLIGLNGQPMDSSLVHDQMTLAVFLNSQDTKTEERLRGLAMLHRQFDERNDFKILIHFTDDPDLNTIQQRSKLVDEEQIYLVKGTPGTIQQLIKTAYRLPDLDQPREAGSTLDFKPSDNSNINDYPFYVLIDEEGIIRNYYHADRPEDVERMVEHIALTLPRNIEGDPRLRRNKEL